MKDRTITQTFIFPDNVSEADARRFMEAKLKEIREQDERERWFRDEVRRRGLVPAGPFSSLFRGLF